MSKNVWQIAAGEQGRYYDDLFVKHNIMFMGPGEYGPFDNAIYSVQAAEGLITDHKKNQIRKFVNDPKEGDIVLLRKGLAVVSIGVVADNNYKWDKRFDDVYGWDLQHTRRIIWQNDLENELQAIQSYNNGDCSYLKPIFGERKQIPTFTGVEDNRIKEPIKYLFDKVKINDIEPLDLVVPDPLSFDELGEMLFSKGLANDSVDEVINALKRQRRLGKWYTETPGQKRPTEHEVVAHMILPLMLGLGWSEQLMAVEWQKVDLAGFCRTPTKSKDCVLVCEAKQMWHPLQPALEQAKNYVENLQLTNCKRIMLTDGVRIYLYKQLNNKWSNQPVGYINTNLIRTDHIAPLGTNAVETLIELTPTAR